LSRTRVINFHDGVERDSIFHSPSPHNIVYGCLFLRFRRQRGSENWKCKTVKSTTVFLLSCWVTYSYIIYVYIHAHIYIYTVIQSRMWHTACTYFSLSPPIIPYKGPGVFPPLRSHVAVSLVPIKGAQWQIIFVSPGGSPGYRYLSLFVSYTNRGGVIIFRDISAKPSGFNITITVPGDLARGDNNRGRLCLRAPVIRLRA